MKLSVWAKQQGLTYKGAWKMFHAGKLPLPAEQLPTGTVIIHAAETRSQGVALYARVSSADQKADLDRQLARLSEYAAGQRLLVVDTVLEIGSGLNGHRRNMLKLLSNPQVSAIVVEPDELADDIVRDLHEVIVSMCARLYGKRSAMNRAQKALAALHSPESPLP